MRLRQSTQRRPPRRYSLDPPSTPLRPSPLRRNGRRKVPTASRSHTHQRHSDAVLQRDSSSRQSCALSTSSTPQRQRTAFSAASSSHCSFNAQSATMVNGRTVRLRNKGADPPAASRARKRKHDLLDDSAFDAWLVERPFELDPQLYLGSIAGEEHHHNELPAAFPSLNPGQERPVNHGRHDIARLIEERKDAATRGDSYERIDQIYNDNIFPSNMAEEEQDWYRDLNDRLVDSNYADKIDIMSLYYSLRQTIILEMCGEVEGIHLYDHFYPAKFLLNLSNRGIQKAMEETDSRNDKHFDLRMAKKGQNPEDPIDPEEPLGFEVVDAIKYLKQNHLPASLLGKWQLPLPDEDAFKDPATKASYAPEVIEESAEVSTHTGSLVTELNQSKISGSHVSPASRRTLLKLIEGIEQAPLSPKMGPSTFMGTAKAKLQATTANSPAPSPSPSPSPSSSNSPQAYSSVASSESSPASPVLSPAPSQSRSKITDTQLAGAAFVSPKEDFDPDYEPSESHDSQDKEKVAAETLVEPSTPPTKFDEPAQNTTSTSKFDHSRRSYNNIIGPRVSPLVREEEAYTPKPADARDELAKTRKTPSKSVFENFEEQTQIVRALNARVNGTSSPQQIRPPMAQPNQRSAQQQQNGHPMYAMMSPEQQTKMQQLERQQMLQQNNYAGQQQLMRQQHNYGLPLYGQQSPIQTAQQYSQQMQQIQQAQQAQRGMQSPQPQEYGMHMPQMGSPNYWLVQQQQLIRNGMNHSSRQPARQQQPTQQHEVLYSPHQQSRAGTPQMAYPGMGAFYQQPSMQQPATQYSPNRQQPPQQHSPQHSPYQQQSAQLGSPYYRQQWLHANTPQAGYQLFDPRQQHPVQNVHGRFPVQGANNMAFQKYTHEQIRKLQQSHSSEEAENLIKQHKPHEIFGLHPNNSHGRSSQVAGPNHPAPQASGQNQHGEKVVLNSVEEVKQLMGSSSSRKRGHEELLKDPRIRIQSSPKRARANSEGRVVDPMLDYVGNDDGMN